EIGAATRGDVIERARAIGFGALDPRTGLELLERLMRSDIAHAAAIAVDWEAYLAQHPALAGRALYDHVRSAVARDIESPGGGAAHSLLDTVMSAPSTNRREMLFDGLHAAAARALGLTQGELIDAAVPLTELG